MKNELVTQRKMQSCAVYPTLFSCGPVLLSSPILVLSVSELRGQCKEKHLPRAGRAGWGGAAGVAAGVWPGSLGAPGEDRPFPRKGRRRLRSAPTQ